MDDSFTRSLYIGRDKAFEVARRREAVEKELKTRRETKIREQNDRQARAAQQKEQELKERIRQRHEKELKRQRAVLDRRCAQLERDKVKKAEILQKAHSAMSRSAQIQRKSIYAFGSSTPRAPTYLEMPRNYITKEFSASSDRLGSPGTSGDIVLNRQTVAMRTPSRIMGNSTVTPMTRTGGSAVPHVMIRSVFGRITTARPMRSPAMITSGGRSDGRRNTTSTSSSNNESSGGESASGAIRRTTPSIMTQSLYNGGAKGPSPPFTKPTLISPTKPANKNSTLSRNVRPLSSVVKVAADELSTLPVSRPPAIRPRKAIQKQETKEVVKTADDTSATESATVLPVTENNVVTDLSGEMASASLQESNIQSEHSTNFDGVIKVAETSKIHYQGVSDVTGDIGSNVEQVIKWDDESQNYGVSLEPSTTASINSVADSELESSTNSSTGNLLTAGSKEEWDSGHESNCANDVDIAQMSLSKVLRISQVNVEEPFSLATPKARSVEENGGDATKFEEMSNNYKVIPEPAVIKSPVVAALDAEEKDRESRRQKLLEILQRTRNSGNLPTPNSSTASLSGSAESPIRKNSAGLDANALAQDLLAQRRQKLQDMAAAQATSDYSNASVNAITPTSSISGAFDKSSDSDSNGVGFYTNEPVINTNLTYAQQTVNVALNGNESGNSMLKSNSNGAIDEHFRENALVKLPGEMLPHIDVLNQKQQQRKFENVPMASDMVNQHQTDPEDPRMERQQENGDSIKTDNTELVQETQTVTASH